MRVLVGNTDRAQSKIPAPDDAPRLADEYLLEVYRQACENARMYATSRFSNLSAFLTYVSLLTAGLAFLLSSLSNSPGLLVPGACLVVGVMGFVVSFLFSALEVRHHHWWKHYEKHGVRRLEEIMGHTQYPDPKTSMDKRDFIDPSPLRLGATQATYGIYVASASFFVLVTVAAVGLIIVRA
jgi:hypothetical protein